MLNRLLLETKERYDGFKEWAPRKRTIEHFEHDTKIEITMLAMPPTFRIRTIARRKHASNTGIKGVTHYIV